MWEKYKTALVTIEQNPDKTFKRVNGQKIVKFLEKWQEAKPKTDKQIKDHFEKPNAALAMLTGKVNNITVIDFDSKDNDLMMELAAISPTKIVETEKGFHFYYKYIPDEDFYTKAGAFGEGVDCRNNGGVIFCPPTPNYITYGEDPISEINNEAKELLRSKMQGKKKIDLANTTTRNDDLFRMACGWIDHYDEKEVWSKMVKANTEFRKGSLDDDELEIIYNQAVKYKKTGQEPEEESKYKLVTLDKVICDTNYEQRYSLGVQALDDAMRDEDFFSTDVQGGLALGEFLAISGRPGNGKTLFAAQITQAMQAQNIKSLWFSYEAKLKKLKRIFEKLGADTRLIASIEIEKNIPMLGNINWIEYYVEQAVKQGVRLVVIDNLDFLETRNDRVANYSQNQQAFLSSIVAELSKMALQYQIMIILIAHVRKPQSQGFKVKRPFLYDIAGTSSVERLCNFGIIIDREADNDENYSNKSFIYLDKNRESGVRKKVEMEYSNGRLKETGSELLKYAKKLYDTI